MRIILTLLLLLGSLFPIVNVSAAEQELRCDCTFTLGLTKKVHAGKPFTDIPDADIITFKAVHKQEDGTLSDSWIYPTEGLSKGDEFGPFVAYSNIIAALNEKNDPKIEAVDVSAGILTYNGEEYVGIGSISSFNGKQIFSFGTDPNWKIDIDKKVTCMPDAFVAKYGVAVHDFGPNGKMLFSMSCSDILVDPTTTGLPEKGDPNKGSVNGVPGGGGNGLGGLAIQSKLDPIGTSLQVLFGRLIKIGLSILGSVALVIFIYGGLLWMTAMGNAEQSKKAFSTLLWGILGVIVILASYGIVDFVLHSFK